MKRQLTEKTFFHFLKCPSWVYQKAQGKGEDPSHPLRERLLDDGLLPEKQREILSLRPDIAEVQAEDIEEAFYQTLEYMKAGRQTIYQGVLLHGHWIGSPDVLEKVEGASSFGRYYYVAADIKRARVIREDYKFQGCFYAELLAKIQKTKPVLGYIITPDQQALGYLIEAFESQYKLTLHQIERILAGEKPIHFLTSGCKQSPWFSTCKQDSVSCKDLSLLNRVWKQEVVALQQVGIKTIDALAKHSLSELIKKCPALSKERLEQIRLQAIALQQGKHFFLGVMEFPQTTTALFFDIESDPLRDFDYLFGVLEVTGKKQTYHSFFARKPEEQEKIWKQFTDFLEQYPQAPVYHYGWFEKETCARLGQRYGISQSLQKSLQTRMIDLHEVIRSLVVFPLSFYSLKDLAQYIGFSWRDKEANGANSVLWFEEYLQAKTGKKKIRDRILQYNEDDVQATYVLQEWLKEQGGKKPMSL